MHHTPQTEPWLLVAGALRWFRAIMHGPAISDRAQNKWFSSGNITILRLLESKSKIKRQEAISVLLFWPERLQCVIKQYDEVVMFKLLVSSYHFAWSPWFAIFTCFPLKKKKKKITRHTFRKNKINKTEDGFNVSECVCDYRCPWGAGRPNRPRGAPFPSLTWQTLVNETMLF